MTPSLSVSVSLCQPLEAEDIAGAIVYAISTPPRVQVGLAGLIPPFNTHLSVSADPRYSRATNTPALLDADADDERFCREIFSRMRSVNDCVFRFPGERMLWS